MIRRPARPPEEKVSQRSTLQSFGLIASWRAELRDARPSTGVAATANAQGIRLCAYRRTASHWLSPSSRASRSTASAFPLPR